MSTAGVARIIHNKYLTLYLQLMSIAEGINLYSILYSISYYKSSLGIMAYNVSAVCDVWGGQ